MNRSMIKEVESTATQGKVCVIGAGISGLSIAYRLKKENPCVSLVEKDTRVGGWIRSSFEEGFFFESGPRSLRSVDCRETLQLIKELGLEDQLIEAPKEAFSRYLLHRGRIEKIPQSFLKFFTSPLTRPHFVSLLKEFFVPKKTDGDESVFHFFSRHFSSSFAEQFADPMTRGIFAADCRELSLPACFPKLNEMEKKHRSLILGTFFGEKTKEKSALYTLKGGLEELPKALARSLGDSVRLSMPVRKIALKENQVELTFDHGVEIYDHVVSALPAHSLQALLPESSLKNLLQSITFTSVTVVKMGYRRKVNRFEGFGYLVPSKEKSSLLGVVFDSSAFPFQNRESEETRLTVMLEGVDRSSEQALLLAKEELASHLGILIEPDFAQVFHAKQAIPKYSVGFPGLLKKIEEAVLDFPRLSLLGTSFYGVSVNQAIFHAMHHKTFQK